MTDIEVKDVEKEVQPEVAQEAPGGNEAPSVEVDARKLGWKPEDEYEGEPGKWVGAEEFVSRAPLYEKNRKLSKKLKELESTVNLLSEHNKKVEETAYKRALETLKAEKVKALDEGNHQAVAEIDDQILELKTETKPVKEKEKRSTREFDEWVEKNPWYETDNELRLFANFHGDQFAKENVGADPVAVFKYAEKKVMERFPEKFRNQNRSKPSSVEGGARSSAKSKNPSWNELPEIFQTVGNKFVRNGVMTREQYIEQLIKTGDIKGA